MMSEDGLGEEGHAWRKGDRVFVRHGAAQVNSLNRQAARIHEEVGEEMGMDASRMRIPRISEQITVFDVVREECYQIFIHQVNRGCMTAAQGQLVKLSERRFAPCRARELRLATPAHYRRSEGVDPDIADPHDGLLTKDATPLIRQELALGEPGSLVHSRTASLTYSSSPDDPWVYCTSMSPANSREATELRARFPRYDAQTVIGDPASFAMQLGIDFAIGIDKSEHVELDPVDEEAYRRSRYTVSLWEGEHRLDKFLRVYHGPVVYEDRSGVVASMEDVVDFSMVPRGWFTKKTRFSAEREYRFAVSTLGRPRREIFALSISDELRALATKA